MGSRKMWIEVTVLEGPGSHGQAPSNQTETYDVVPTNYELKGRLTLDVKPQFLKSAMMRIGKSDAPVPSSSVATEKERIYEPVKEGDIKDDVDDMMTSLTGKDTTPFVSLIGELVDDLLRPGKPKR